MTLMLPVVYTAEATSLFIEMANEDREGSFPLNESQRKMVRYAMVGFAMINQTQYPRSGIDGFDFKEMYLVEPLDKFLTAELVSMDGSVDLENYMIDRQILQISPEDADLDPGECMEAITKLSAFVKSNFKGYQSHRLISVAEARKRLSLRDSDNWDRISFEGRLHYLSRLAYWKGMPVRCSISIYPKEDNNYDDIVAFKRFIGAFARFDDENYGGNSDDNKSKHGKS